MRLMAEGSAGVAGQHRLRTPNFDGIVEGARNKPAVEHVERPHSGAFERAAAGPVGAPHPNGVVAACGYLCQRRGKGLVGGCG